MQSRIYDASKQNKLRQNSYHKFNFITETKIYSNIQKILAICIFLGNCVKQTMEIDGISFMNQHFW